MTLEAKYPRINDWAAPFADLERIYAPENPSHNVRIESLDLIRLACWSETSRTSAEVVDLIEGPAHARSKQNSAKYTSILRGMEAKRKRNESQDTLLIDPSAIQGRIGVVQGC